jgi:DNA-directed RNA polymerase specialized sigma24 family protein
MAPTHEDFERLFAFLDADPTRAAAKYDQIRLRLLKLFAWRGCTPAQEFADKAIERVIRRLAGGNERQATEPFQHFYGVAMNILRERAADTPATPDAPLPDDGPTRPAEDAARSAEARRRLKALRGSLDELAPPYRYLVLDYHRRHSSPTWLDELAQSHGVPASALRLRVHRLRSAVERSVTAELSQAQKTGDAAPSNQERLS